MQRKGAFLPFSLGSRDCIGQSLAMLELRVVVATLVSHFSLALTPEMGGFKGVAAGARQYITLKPSAGTMMYCKPRV